MRMSTHIDGASRSDLALVRSNVRWAVVAFALAALLVAWPGGQIAFGQNRVVWSEPRLIFTSAWVVETPLIVADALDGIHAFWQEAQSGSSAPHQVYYTRVSARETSTPVVIVTNARAAAVTADRAGNLYLLFQRDNDMMISYADASRAGAPESWSKPVVIAKRTLFRGDITVDDRGTLHVALPSLDRRGVYYAASGDGGETWSLVLAGRPAEADTQADWTRLAVDGRGGLHVTWSEFRLPNGWPPTGLYYARSQDAGLNWTRPMTLAGESWTQAAVGIGPGDQVNLVWNAYGPNPGHYHRVSSDGGNTWSTKATPAWPDRGSMYGYPDLAVDSAGTLHMVSPSVGVLYGAWRDGAWTAPVKIPDGPSGADKPGDQENWRGFPHVAISGGNQLHVLFAVGAQRIYYSSAQTGSPAVTPPPLPTATPRPTATAKPAAAPTTGASGSGRPQGFSDGPAAAGPAGSTAPNANTGQRPAESQVNLDGLAQIGLITLAIAVAMFAVMASLRAKK